MNIKSVLLNIVHDLGDERFDLINCGGCCWFAGVLATELEKKDSFYICNERINIPQHPKNI